MTIHVACVVEANFQHQQTDIMIANPCVLNGGGLKHQSGDKCFVFSRARTIHDNPCVMKGGQLQCQSNEIIQYK